MSQSFAALAAAAGALFATGCGYIGEPLPPLANVPAKVTDLAAIQRGPNIIVQFTIPELTTEGREIKEPVKLDLRIGAWGESFDAAKWEAQAKSIPQGPPKAGFAYYEIPAAQWINQEPVLAVKVVGANGKDVGWSNLLAIHVVPPPERPSAVTTIATAQGVHLTWRAAGATFRVFRKAADAKEFALVATVQQPEWTDATAEYGKPYTYEVQTIAALANNKEAQSDLSEDASLTPVDTFPPAAPSGLTISVAVSSVELVWDRNTEPDLAGYRVYRATGAGAFEKIADVSQIPSYSDHSVEHGKTYRYAVLAFDLAGNSSARTEPVEVMVP